jgi:hypothetical protein
VIVQAQLDKGDHHLPAKAKSEQHMQLSNRPAQQIALDGAAALITAINSGIQRRTCHG